VADVRLASDLLAIFLNNLIAQKAIAASSTVIVGHSAGAHLAGMTGAQIAGLRGIVGLDPAGPFFDCQPTLGLTPKSATFVQVLHTNYNESLRYGTVLSRGHVDYYANYLMSSIQPGSCSHFRAFDLFLQAMAPTGKCAFKATPIGKTTATPMTVFDAASMKTLLGSTFTMPKTLGNFNILTSSNSTSLCVTVRTIACHLIVVVALLKIVSGQACNDNPLNSMSTFANMQSERSYRAKNIRQSATCSMPDRSTRAYNKTGIWSGSTYPDCNLKIRFILYTDASGKATTFSGQNISAALPTGVATALANKKPLLVLFIGTEVESGSIKINTLRDWIIKAGNNVLMPLYDSTAGMDFLAGVGDSRLAADILAIFLNNLIKQKAVSAASMVFIGHSVGAHVAALAAAQIPGLRALIDLCHNEVSTNDFHLKFCYECNVSLDPTGVFYDCKSNLGLTKSVAIFVQVLHTTGNESVRYGSVVDRGHVDYYANYGVKPQPGCGPTATPPLSGAADPRIVACSHIRAFDIFYQAMDPNRKCQLTAVQIPSGSSKVAPISMAILTPDSLKSLTASSASFTLPSVLGRFNVQTSTDANNLCVQAASVAAARKGGFNKKPLTEKTPQICQEKVDQPWKIEFFFHFRYSQRLCNKEIRKYAKMLMQRDSSRCG
uniref:Lipase domain-containing protein n=1 Tax=Romanomermis culicivorax TaxID=13658 RepID=A0A915KE87_ROMCU